MGYDPYWPTCLASINVLCVPVRAIDASRYDEICSALKSITAVDYGDDSSSDGPAAGPETSSPNVGTPLVNISSYEDSSSAQRVLLEPNATPQVILGIFDASAEMKAGEADQDHNAILVDGLQTLQARYLSDHGARICAILTVGSNGINQHDYLIPVANLGESDMCLAITRAFTLLRHELNQFANKIIDQDSIDSSLIGPIGSPIAATDQNTASVASGDVNASTATTPRDILKMRCRIVSGLLKLQLGEWSEALRSLVEGAASARQVEDAPWQARALEAMLVCTLLMAWKDIPFEVPTVWEQAFNTSQLIGRSSFFGRPASLGAPSQIKADAGLSSMQKWIKYTPTMAQAILSLYESLDHSQAQLILSTVVTESRIRMINLLIFASDGSSASRPDNLDTFILQHQFSKSEISSITYATSIGVNIPNLLLAALSSKPVQSFNDDDIAATLAVASSLSSVGSIHRHALILRSLLQRLAPALARARKVGASEAGVHPSSAMLAPDAIRSQQVAGAGILPLLQSVASAYGVSIQSSAPVGDLTALSKSQIEQNLSLWCANRADGDLSLKIDILRLCVSVCDAIEYLDGALTFISALLRLAISYPTLSTRERAPGLAVNAREQSKLLEEFRRNISAISRHTTPDVAITYWNDFLVRDIQLLVASESTALHSHAPAELSSIESKPDAQGRDPFIFNPFAKAATVEAAPVVVAGEMVAFSVLLQNPLEIDVDVSDIMLAADGCAFEPNHHSVILGAGMSQIFTLSGMAQQAGSLKVIGCDAVIEGCRRQRFPVMKHDWQPPIKVKQKMSGRFVDHALLFTPSEMKLADADVLRLTVIEPQPHLEVVSSSETQPSLMLLEGERRSCKLTVKSASPEIASDFVLLSSTDNVSRGLTTTLSRKDLSPVDMYEIQHQLRYCQAIQIKSEPGTEDLGASVSETTYTFEVFGRAGLSEAAIHIDFARLGKARSEVKETFYTRQLRHPLAVTVNGSIDIVRCNIMPVVGDVLKPRNFSRTAREDVSLVKNSLSTSEVSDGVAMLSLDLRNVWPEPLTIEIASRTGLTKQGDQTAEDYIVSEAIQPGQVSRIIVMIPRLLIADPFAPIPSLEQQRQFVVSTSKMSVEAEMGTRENFWYREELLKQIKGVWKEEKSGRTGEIDLRKGIRLNLNARMIDVLRVEHVDISYELIPQGKTPASAVKEMGHSHYRLQTEAFATLRVSIRNRSKDRLSLLVRLQPSLRDQPHGIALDLNRRLMWSGVLQQPIVPQLAPEETRTVDLGLIVLVEGNYEINATVEEARPRKRTAEALGSLDINGQRRVWHARCPCQIDAVNEETP